MNRKAPWVLAMRRPQGSKARRYIRQVSKARASRLKIYAAVRTAFLRHHPRCEALVICKAARSPKATDIHHTRGRVGTLLTDERFFVAVCRQCHEWIGSNPAAARARGLLCEAGKWNTPA